MEINQVLTQVEETLGLTNSSKKLNEVLAGDEKRILDLKYHSKRFCLMNATEIIQQCRILLLRINVITGWVLPTNELTNILIDQVCKKMLEAYPDMNIDEVEYAFRNRPTEIKDWGKNFSITLLDEVLMPYLEKRLDVSDAEQRVKEIPVQKVYTDEEILNQRRAEIENAFQNMKKGYYPLLHSYFKEILVEDELMGKDEAIGEFFVRRINSQSENIYTKE